VQRAATAILLVFLALALLPWPSYLARAALTTASHVGPAEDGGDFTLKDAYWSDWRGKGFNNTFSVVLKYLSRPEASSLNATLDVSAISPETGLVNDSYPGPLKASQSVVFSFTFPVPENASASHYNLTLTVSYLKGGELETYECLVQATVEGTPHLAIACSTRELDKRVLNTVRLKVLNDGDGVARSIRLEVNPQSLYMTVIGPNVFERDLLWPGEEWVIELAVYVEAGAGGSLAFRVATRYDDQRGSPYSQGISFGFETKELAGPDLKIEALNSSVRPDAMNRLVFRVRNLGREEARNITVSFYSYAELLSVVGPGTFKKSRLGPGEDWNITLIVFVQPKVYGAVGIYISMSYSDPRGAEQSETTQIGLEVKGKAELAISKVICMPPAVVPGDKYVFLMVLLTNVGDYVAKEVRLKLGSVPGLIEPSYTGAEEAMIPYVPMGYPVNATFVVNVADDAKPGFYEIPLHVSHDGLNYTLHVPFTIREKASFKVLKMEFSPKPYPGSKGVRVTLELKNVANVTAEQVRLSIVSAYIRGVTSILLGDLRGGESRVAVFEVDFDDSAPLEFVFDLQISWYQGERALTYTMRMSMQLMAPSKWPEVREVMVWVAFMGLGAAATFVVIKLRRGVF